MVVVVFLMTVVMLVFMVVVVMVFLTTVVMLVFMVMLVVFLMTVVMAGLGGGRGVLWLYSDKCIA